MPPDTLSAWRTDRLLKAATFSTARTAACSPLQTWGAAFAETFQNQDGFAQPYSLNASDCSSCRQYALWIDDAMINPLTRQGEPPHSDMPEDVVAIYNEAREVGSISRKSAAGLVRLGLQMLIEDLVPGGGTIDAKIGALVKSGLDPQVQQAMDVLRVVGNESVHPGEIDLVARVVS